MNRTVRTAQGASQPWPWPKLVPPPAPAAVLQVGEIVIFFDEDAEQLEVEIIESYGMHRFHVGGDTFAERPGYIGAIKGVPFKPHLFRPCDLARRGEEGVSYLRLISTRGH